jgi:hypothetical protein
MTVEESFKQSDLLNLATLVESQFAASFGIKIDRQNWSAKILGVLNLSHDEIETDLLAYCSFEICHDWWKNLPTAYCNDYWVRKDIDFHIGEDGWICFDVDVRWQKYVANVLKQEGMRAAALYGAAWFSHHCRWLLYRHHYFYVNNISEWPKDLPAWGHGNEGRREFFLNEFRKRQRKSRREFASGF